MSRTAGRQKSQGTLPAILEDGDLSTPTPPYVHGSTNEFAAAEKQISKSPTQLRLDKFFAKRGGWKRFALLALLLLLGVVGLIVGLVIGLRNKSSSNGDNSISIPNPTTNATFPAGSYMIETALIKINTSCTSNSQTWRCYPYSTYTDSPNTSAALFDWIIQPLSSTSGSYTISSTNNVFALLFINLPLILEDQGTATERYTFQVTMNKAVIPTVSITPDNKAATCYFNSTVFQANLYTRRTKTYDLNSSTSSGTFQPWPYAASIEQTSTSAPQCFDVAGSQVGNFAIQGSGQSCSCMYMNYDL